MNTNLKNFIKAIPGLRTVVIASRSVIGETKAFYDWRKLARKEEIFLELGSGTKKGTNGFTTVDRGGADIYRDLRKGIPLKDNTVSIIYISHMLEHIPYSQLMPFLKECWRVLKTDGHISVCVPNARNYIQAYVEKRNFRNPQELYASAIVDTGSWIDQVNYIAYMAGEHCYMFDDENIINTLYKVGFSSVRLRSFDQSIDLKEREFESIYAVATK